MKDFLLFITSLLMLAFVFTHCSKDCESDIPACQEAPADSGFCAAYFESWFYQDNKCVKIAYSGCTAKGFETKEFCEECGCN